MESSQHQVPPSTYSHEVHLPPKKQSIASKVNAEEFDTSAYEDALTAAAWSRQCRFLAQANAAAPFANNDGDRESLQREVHWAAKKAEVVDKVSTGAANPAIYSANLEQTARGKAERFYAAATAAAPFATANPGSEAPGERYPTDYVLRRPRKGSEVAGKVGEHDHEAALYSDCVANLQSAASGKADRFHRAVHAEAPFAVQPGVGGGQERDKVEYHMRARNQEVKGKPNVEEFDSNEVAAARLANQLAGASAKVRNQGVPGLLRHDM